MEKRFVSIWFRHLNTDWFSLVNPALKNTAFVLRTPVHGRMIITSTNAVAEMMGIRVGTVLADARAISPELEVLDDKPDLPEKLLHRLAEWCIRFSPFVSVDLPDGLFIDATGCTHLWGSESEYVQTIERKLRDRGYHTRLAIADTPGVAWAMARYGNDPLIVPAGKNREALMNLPPQSLRIDEEVSIRLHQLGLHEVRQFIKIPRHSLRRRFGQQLLYRIDCALGNELEMIDPVQPLEPYEERLPCMEPILTATAIEMALHELLLKLCSRLRDDQMGIRSAIFKGYRIDGKIEQIEIATNRPSHHVKHLFKLFELKISTIEPALGIDLFVLQAPKVETLIDQQGEMWMGTSSLDDQRLAELFDRLACRTGLKSIYRFLPDEHYWPERSVKVVNTLSEEPVTTWRTDKARPAYLLPVPEKIEVTAPIPDYPPMLFRYQGKLYKIVKADGPERIEQEWWLQQGQHRDYYRVEDEAGARYWLFRLGHYHDENYQWFLHGFFA